MMRRASFRMALRRFRREEDGANLVEFSLVVLLFLFLLFAIIDFGRIANAWVGANKATQIAARTAAVRPPVCDEATFPLTNARGGAPGNFGSLCRSAPGMCLDPFITENVDPDGHGYRECTAADSSTGQSIFAQVRPLLPAGTTEDELVFRYSYDPNLGFLGGPFVPMVTVELEGVDFTYVSQLGVMIQALTGNDSNLGADLEVPGMSVSLPGEDLSLGG